MKQFLKFLLLCFFFLAPIIASGEPALSDSLVVKKIIVLGAVRTQSSVIIREVGIAEGSETTIVKIEEGIQRLKNTQLFSEVVYTVADDVLQISVVDRWTLIPIAKFSSGGGVNQLIIGAYDANLSGRFYETGAQYERLGEANSGVFWFKNPRLFGERVGLDFQAWNTNRLRTKYEQSGLDPVVKKGFLLSREKYYVALNKEVTREFDVGATIEYNGDSFSERYVEDEIKLKTSAAGGLPVNTNLLFVGIRSKYGLVNYDSWRVSGKDIELGIRRGDPTRSMNPKNKVKGFEAFDLKLRYFIPIFADQTIAWRGMIGTTNTQIIQYWNYFGGLADIRGFVDNRFAGRSYWLSNLEYRIAFFQRNWLVLQQVTFYDSLSAAEDYRDLNSASAASAGIGIRIIAPTVYRLVARIDFAKPLVKRDAIPVSFGVQQFF